MKYGLLLSIPPFKRAGALQLKKTQTMASQIWSVCCMWTNFRRKLINEDGTDID